MEGCGSVEGCGWAAEKVQTEMKRKKIRAWIGMEGKGRRKVKGRRNVNYDVDYLPLLL